MKPKIEIYSCRKRPKRHVITRCKCAELPAWRIIVVTSAKTDSGSHRSIKTIAETRCEKVKDIIVEALRKAVEEGRYE